MRPLLDRDDVDLVRTSGGLPDLLSRLRVHFLDLVLCSQRIHASTVEPWNVAASLVGQ